jgi:hypothetical protein
LPSVDGNYLKMQGEALARLQVAYQAETQSQQARALVASEKAIQRLREEVVALSRSDGQDRGMAAVGERGEGASQDKPRRGPGGRREKQELDLDVFPPKADGSGLRLDVRV